MKIPKSPFTPPLSRFALIATTLLLFAATASAEPSRDISYDPVKISWAGKDRVAYVHIPSGPKSTQPRAVLLAFHGGGGTALGFERIAGLVPYSDREGFLLVYPDGIAKAWDDGRPEQHTAYDDVGFIKQLLDRLVREYGADPKRIYSTGISNGGLFSFRLACEVSDRIAGIAVIAANIGEALSQRCAPARGMPVVLFMGDKDPLIPFQGGQITGPFGLKKRGAVLSSDATAAYWRGRNHCQENPAQERLPDTAHDGTEVRRETYSGCAPGTSLTRYVIHGGGHTWPGGWQYLGKFLVGVSSRNADASRELVRHLGLQAAAINVKDGAAGKAPGR